MFIMPMSEIGFGAHYGASGYTISNAVWFDASSSDYLSRTPSSAGNRKTWTFSAWVKRGQINALSGVHLFGADRGSGYGDRITFGNGDTDDRFNATFNDAGSGRLQTKAFFRDPSGWTHFLVVVDTDQGGSYTAANAVKIYINGTLLTADDLDTASYPAEDYETAVNNTAAQMIGARGGSASQFMDGYMAEVILLDGTAVSDASSFGELNDDGVWVPINPSGLDFSGTNSFHLDFKVAPGTGNGAGTDVSGNGNHFTDNSMTAAQRVTDTCTDDADNDADNNIGNYWTLNPLQSNNTLTGGNLAFTGPTNYSNYSTAPALPITGKWYWEIKAVGSAPITSSANWDTYVGVLRTDVAIPSGSQNSNANLWVWGNMAKDGSGANGQKHNNSSVSFVPAVNFGNNSIMMIAVDMDNSKIYFGNDGTWAGSADPAAGSNPAFTSSDSSFGSHQVMPYQTLYADSATYNFGATAFAHTPPTGFKALNTANLPAPTVTKPSDYFNTVLYTANNSDGHEISTVGFVPDFVWIKDRDTAASHVVFDVVRGVSPSANNYLTVNTTDTEGQGGFTNTMVQLGKAANGSTVINGFTLDDDSNDQRVNYGGAMVAWCWKAGGAASSNGNGSITTSVSAADHGGFSIATWTGNGSAGATIGHGLSRKPAMGIFRRKSLAQDWAVYHEGSDASAPEDKYLNLNLTDGVGDATWLNDTPPSASLWTLGTSGYVNTSSETFVAYSFARTPGLIGIGSYVGNGSADGAMVVVDDGGSGFRPAWVMIKRLEAGYAWHIQDAVRSPHNPTALGINANDTGGDSASTGFDFIANGFKLRAGSDGGYNGSGATYIYLAFAEHPFGGDGVAQARAR